MEFVITSCGFFVRDNQVIVKLIVYSSKQIETNDLTLCFVAEFLGVFFIKEEDIFGLRIGSVIELR